MLHTGRRPWRLFYLAFGLPFVAGMSNAQTPALTTIYVEVVMRVGAGSAAE
jgi:hypothetical protein